MTRITTGSPSSSRSRLLLLCSCSSSSLWWCIVGIISLTTFQYTNFIECDARLDQYGPYKVQKMSLRLRGVLDSSNPVAVITYPESIRDNEKRNISNNTTTTQPQQQQEQQEQQQSLFPLLLFTHGFMTGGRKTYLLHKGLLDGLASFGFIVVAHQSCNWGCPRYGQWDTYDDEIITLINYIDSNNDAKNHSILQYVNRTVGYGIIGHSVGGRAAAQALQVASANNVHAGVILHPIPDDDIIITVPTAVFTGSKDQCCGYNSSQRIYNSISSSTPRAFADMIDGKHTEPNFDTDWTAFVSAWFHIHLLGETNGYSYDLIYGNSDNSLTVKSLCSVDSELPMVPETCEVHK